MAAARFVSRLSFVLSESMRNTIVVLFPLFLSLYIYIYINIIRQHDLAERLRKAGETADSWAAQRAIKTSMDSPKDFAHSWRPSYMSGLAANRDGFVGAWLGKSRPPDGGVMLQQHQLDHTRERSHRLHRKQETGCAHFRQPPVYGAAD